MIKKLSFFFLLSSLIFAFLLFKPSSYRSVDTVFFPRGINLSQISNILLKNNVIESAFFFKLVALSLKLDKKVKAGEYLFENKTSLYNTFKKINSGDHYFRKFVVIEGTTTEKVINDLNANLYLSGKINKKIEEGTLFPETYFFLRNDNREKLLLRMQEKMHETIDGIWSSKKSFIDSKEKLIKLASLIEAETKLNSEKYIVSSVFHNRIKLNMRLQSDPTVLYAKNLNNKKKK